MKKLTILFLALLIPVLAFAFTYTWVIDQMEYANDAAAQAAYVSSDAIGYLLDEDCSDISDWADADIGTAVSEVSPAGQFRFDTNLGAADNAKAVRSRVIDSPPDKFTIEVKTYFDSLGTMANLDSMYFYAAQTTTWQLQIRFASDGLYILKIGAATTEVGTNIVKYGGSAAWQIWRFEVDKSGGEDVATVEVFLDGASQGTFDCDYETDSLDGRVEFRQLGYTTDNIVSHIDYLKIATGLGTIESPVNLQSYSESTIKTQGSYSLKGVAVITDSLNDTLTRTLADNLDLSNSEAIEYDIYALRTGSNIKIGIHDSGGTTTEHTANVASSNTNQTESWDISGVSDANKDDIDSIIITIMNADAANTFYLDDIKWGVNAGGSWTFVN